jgi:TolB-like protein
MVKDMLAHLRSLVLTTASAAVLIAVSGPARAGEQAPADTRKRVAVLEFEGGGAPQHLAAAVADAFQTALAESKQFRVVERRRLAELTEEMQKAMVGLVDPATAKDMGKTLGAEYLLMGSVSKLGSNITLNVRMVDVESGEARVARTATATSEDALLGEVKKLVRYFVDVDKGGEAAARAEADPDVDKRMFHQVIDLSAGLTLSQIDRLVPVLEGRIGSTMGDDGEVTLGKRQGVLVGQRFEIWGDSMMEGRVKKGIFVATQVFEDRSKGRVFGGSSEMVEDGDTVKTARSRVGVGAIRDESAGDEKVEKAFTEELRKKISGGQRVTLAQDKNVEGALVEAGTNLRAAFPALQKAGVDLFVEGKLYGNPGARTVDLQVWNVHTGDTLTQIKLSTKM